MAIRSALVTRTDAWIHAGAGIVRGSDPEHEYMETTIKERAMRDALGRGLVSGSRASCSAVAAAPGAAPEPVS